MEDELEVQCPYCNDRLEVTVGGGASGRQQEHCPLCGESFHLSWIRDSWGDLDLRVERRPGSGRPGSGLAS